MPTIKNAARVVLPTGQKDIERRRRKILELLQTDGPQTARAIAKHAGYTTANGVAYQLRQLVQEGKIKRSHFTYHLPDQTPVILKDAEGKGFFDGTSATARVRRWLRDHQDEPTTMAKIGREVHCANPNDANYVISRLLEKGLLRRYQSPEDFTFTWRYQYTDPELSGIKVTYTNPNPATLDDRLSGVGNSEPEAVQNAAVAQEGATLTATGGTQEVEPEPQHYPTEEYLLPVKPEPSEQTPATAKSFAGQVEQVAKDFIWKYESNDLRLFVKWLMDEPVQVKEAISEDSTNSRGN